MEEAKLALTQQVQEVGWWPTIPYCLSLMGAPKLQEVQVARKQVLFLESLEMGVWLLVGLADLEAGVITAEVVVVVLMGVAADHPIPRVPF